MRVVDAGPAGTVRAVALAPVLSDIRDHRIAAPERSPAPQRGYTALVETGFAEWRGGVRGRRLGRNRPATRSTAARAAPNPPGDPAQLAIQAGRTSRHGRACAWRSCCGNASRYRSALTCCSRRSTEMGGCRPCPGQLLLGDHARAGAARADAARARHERRAAAGRVRRSAALRLEEQLGFKKAKYVCRLTRSTTTARSVPSRQLARRPSQLQPVAPI